MQERRLASKQANKKESEQNKEASKWTNMKARMRINK